MSGSNKLEKTINNLGKKIAVDSLRENHKQFIKNKRLTFKSQQRFRSKKHNVFTEVVKKTSILLLMIKECNQSIK